MFHHPLGESGKPGIDSHWNRGYPAKKQRDVSTSRFFSLELADAPQPALCFNSAVFYPLRLRFAKLSDFVSPELVEGRIPASKFLFLTSVLCHLTSVFCHLTSVLCPLTSDLCLLPSVIRPLSSDTW